MIAQTIKEITKTVPLIAITPKSWVPKFAAEFVIGTAKDTQIQAKKWEGIDGATSSIFIAMNKLVA